MTMTLDEQQHLTRALASLPVDAGRLVQLLIEREASLVVESETDNGRASLAWEAALDADDGAALAVVDDIVLNLAGRLIRQATDPGRIGFAAAVRRAIGGPLGVRDDRWAIELHAGRGYDSGTADTFAHSRAALGTDTTDAAIMRWCTQQPDLWIHDRRAWIAADRHLYLGSDQTMERRRSGSPAGGGESPAARADTVTGAGDRAPIAQETPA